VFYPFPGPGSLKFKGQSRQRTAILKRISNKSKTLHEKLSFEALAAFWPFEKGINKIFFLRPTIQKKHKFSAPGRGVCPPSG
jgi:hypothetical protein